MEKFILYKVHLALLTLLSPDCYKQPGHVAWRKKEIYAEFWRGQHSFGRLRWRHYITLYLKEAGEEYVNWIKLAEDHV
jgi:hypothetical protein